MMQGDKKTRTRDVEEKPHERSNTNNTERYTILCGRFGLHASSPGDSMRYKQDVEVSSRRLYPHNTISKIWGRTRPHIIDKSVHSRGLGLGSHTSSDKYWYA